MIINSHVHVTTDNYYFFYNNYGLFRLIDEMRTSGIDILLPTLNPKINFFRCPNDCSMSCPIIYGGINNNLDSCNCSVSNRHRICVHDKQSKIALSCRTCGKLILESSVDPLRNYNIDLINITRPFRSFIKPILYISLCKSTIQKEIDFFEKEYRDEFVGFKFHPWNDQVNVSNFRVHTSKPILIHTGIRSLENPQNAIIFAQNNPNTKIVIAHAGSLDEGVLKKIVAMSNVFIDCCPSVFLFEHKESSIQFYQDISCPEDIYYKVLDFVPSSKVLFGSDSPWGNSKQELEVVCRLKIPSRVREQILYKNAMELYKLD